MYFANNGEQYTDDCQCGDMGQLKHEACSNTSFKSECVFRSPNAFCLAIAFGGPARNNAMPIDHLDQTAGSICGQLAHAAHAKKRSPIHSLCWSNEGRRLVTGNRDGEFTLWRGTDFAPPDQSVVTVISAAEEQINSICWRHDGGGCIAGDASGTIKYW